VDLIRHTLWPFFSFTTISGWPAAARNVGSQSWCCTISFETERGLIFLGLLASVTAIAWRVSRVVYTVAQLPPAWD
jgi:hypothetical protein